MKFDRTQHVEPVWTAPVRKYAPVVLLFLVAALLTFTVFIPLYHHQECYENVWTWTGILLTYLALGALGAYLFLLIRHMNTTEQAATADLSALFDANEHLNTILRSVGDGVITTNQEGAVTLMNAVAETLTGWKVGAAAGRKVEEVFQPMREHTRAVIPDPFSQSLQAGRRTHEENALLIARDGTERIVAFSATPLLDDDQWVTGVVIVFRDAGLLRRAQQQRENLINELSQINGRLRAEVANSEQSRRAALNLMQDAQQAQQALRKSEERLRLINERLTESNNALEEYAHVASHDLQEPLRKVESFTAIFLEEYGSKVDETGRQYLDITVNAARRMRRLIKDVLALAEAGASERPFAPVCLDRVLATARDNLSERIRERSAEIEAQPLPEVLGDEAQLTRVFQNFIGNALKFNDKRQPHIEIRPEETPHEWKIIIQDNGIGMNAAEAGKIFAPFKRLHGRKEYEGTGIGLAVCRKIIHRHGGSVGVDSVPGEGSSFWLTLPKTEGNRPGNPEPDVNEEGEEIRS